MAQEAPQPFPTFEHQYAHIQTRWGKAYYKHDVIRIEQSPLGTGVYKYYRCFKNTPAAENGGTTALNFADYFQEITERKAIPRPSHASQSGIQTNTIVFTSDSGAEQRRVRGAPKRIYEISWPVLTFDQYQTIRDFFLMVLNVKAFYWTDPIENRKVLVRFVNELFQARQIGHGPKGPLYSLDLSLVQVWS